MTIVFADPKPTTLDGEPPERRGAARRDDPLLRGDAGRRSSGTAGRSRSSSATRSWRSSGCRSATRTTPSARSGPRPTCRRPCRRSTRSSGRAWGLELRNHIGVNTGEVIAGDASLGQRLVTGDAVNTAARLEQAAGPLEIILGDLTYRLARDQIEVEPIPPLTLKGKAEPVAGLPARQRPRRRRPSAASLTTPFVGREAEMDRLEMTLARGRGDPVVPAGHGHRRRRRRQVAADPRVRDPGGRRATRARSSAVDACRTATASRSGRSPRSSGARPGSPTRTRARSRSRRSPRSPGGPPAARTTRRAIIDRVGAAIGLSTTQFPGPELFWGIRKLLEAIASRRPLVAIVDDIHVAAPTFLELLDHLLDAVHGSPILLLATARHELLETRTEWAEGHEDESVVLEPLSDRRLGRDHRRAAGRARGAGPPADRRRRRGQPAVRRADHVDARRDRRDPARGRATGSRRSRRARSRSRRPSRRSSPPASTRSQNEERQVIDPASVIGLGFAVDAVVEPRPARTWRPPSRSASRR